MAVEIKELVIKAVVVDNVNSNTDSKPGRMDMDSVEFTSQIVQACVKEVLNILERKAAK